MNQSGHAFAPMGLASCLSAVRRAPISRSSLTLYAPAASGCQARAIVQRSMDTALFDDPEVE
jgi:hypothetical protein